MEALDSVVHIVGVKTSDTDSPVQGQIDRVFVHHLLALFLANAGESKHTDLSENVTPVMWAAYSVLEIEKKIIITSIGQLLDKHFSHFSDTARHGHKILVPDASDLWVCEDNLCNSRSVHWGA
jgi:hypothetical protein